MKNYSGQVALVLQGGGALGAYQVGVYEALHDAGVEPDWVIGTSIGAINGAIIAGNPPERRMARLEEFWQMVRSDRVANLWSMWPAVAGAVAHAGIMVNGIDVFFTPNSGATWKGVNGSLGVDGVNGKLDLRTTNGSVSLADVGGDVRAHTQNGSLSVQLAGSKWDGSGLDAETQNGSVRMAIPEGYAAQIETGTVNGGIHTDFPITVQGRIGRRLTLPLNGGGVTLRAMTTNGGVTLSRR